MRAIRPPIELQPLLTASIEELGWGGGVGVGVEGTEGDVKKKKKKQNRIPAPESWDSCKRTGFSEPRLLHLPLHSKAQNFFIWHTWFPIINNFLKFRLPASCCKLLHNLTPPPLPYTHTSSDNFSQGHLRCYLLGLTPQTLPPNKI